MNICRAGQGCRAVWSIPEEFFGQTSLPGDALLRWRPTSPSFKWLSVWKSESEIVSALKSKSKNIFVWYSEFVKMKVKMQLFILNLKWHVKCENESVNIPFKV